MILTCSQMFHIFDIPIKETPFGAPNPKEQQIPRRFKIFVHPYMKRGKSVPRPGVSISTDDRRNVSAMFFSEEEAASLKNVMNKTRICSRKNMYVT